MFSNSTCVALHFGLAVALNAAAAVLAAAQRHEHALPAYDRCVAILEFLVGLALTPGPGATTPDENGWRCLLSACVVKNRDTADSRYGTLHVESTRPIAHSL